MDLKELLELAGHMKMSDKETGFNPLACFIPYVTCKEIVHTQILESIFNLDKSLGAISFINHFLPDIKIDTDTVSVLRERKIKRLLTEGSGDRSIDLCLYWKDSFGKVHSIIIENKINDAYFQEMQIEEYQESLKVVEGENVEATIVIYGNKNKLGETVKDVILISPESLSKWLIKNFSDDENIIAYANYLNTMNQTSIKMENALKLTNLSLEDIKNLNVLNDAFHLLNDAKNEIILNGVRKKHPDVKSTFSKLDGGCKAFQLWNEADYSRNDLWVALFAPENPADDEHGTDLYIYGHAKNDLHGDVDEETGYYKAGIADGYVYYRSPVNFRFQFFDLESRKEMIEEINRILEILTWI